MYQEKSHLLFLAVISDLLKSIFQPNKSCIYLTFLHIFIALYLPLFSRIWDLYFVHWSFWLVWMFRQNTNNLITSRRCFSLPYSCWSEWSISILNTSFTEMSNQKISSLEGMLFCYLYLINILTRFLLSFWNTFLIFRLNSVEWFQFLFIRDVVFTTDLWKKIYWEYLSFIAELLRKAWW